MKTLLLSMLIATSLVTVSCGKKNSVGAASNVIATSPISTINSDSNFQTLAQAIVSNNFSQNANYYTEYHFATVVNKCVTKDGWFGIDYQSCSASTQNETTAIHGQVDLESKKSELNTILSKTVQFQGTSSYFTLRTNDNYTYVIRTDLPMQANPIYKLNNANGSANQLIYIR